MSHTIWSMMDRSILYYLLIFFIVSEVASSDLPSSITRCSRSDPDLNHCILNEAQKYVKEFCKGIPDMGIPPSDPMDVDLIKYDENGLDVEMSKAVVTGHSSAQFANFSINWDEKTGQLSFNIPRIKNVGHYALDGQLLIFTIKGSGPYINEFDNVDCVIDFKFIIKKGKDEKEHLRINWHRLNYKVKDHAYFELKNIFKDSETLSNTVNQVLNMRWEEVVTELAPKAFASVNSILIRNINRFMSKVPLDDLLSP